MPIRPLSGRAAVALAAVAILLASLAGCSRPQRSDAEKRELVAQLYQDIKKSFPDAAEVDPADILSGKAFADAILVDVRSPKEQAVSMIPGAVTEEDYLQNQERHQGRPVAAYCTIGWRSGTFTERLAKRGVTAANMRGGVLGWLFAGGTLVGPDGRPTQTVHVYGSDWDLAPSGFRTVW